MSARILIVEDEAIVAMELRFVLEDLGYQVVGTAAEARAAREIVGSAEIDLALVDIHLSDGPTGIELGRELGQERGVTVLFMTANPGMVRDGVAGTVGVLTKPTDEVAVQSAVDYALRRRKGIPVEYAPPGLADVWLSAHQPMTPSVSSPLEQLVYVSVDTGDITNAIRASGILADARRNNARDYITGALTFTGGRFVQILEGRHDALEDLLLRLERDDRHRDLCILARRRIDQRDFPAWDMVSPRLARSQIDRIDALLAQSEQNLDDYVAVLAEAVASQSEALLKYGYDPRPEVYRHPSEDAASA